MTQIHMSSISLSDVKDANLLKFVDDVAELIKEEVHETLVSQMNNPSKSAPKLRLGNKEYDSVGTVITDYLKKQPAKKKKAIFRNISQAKYSQPLRTYKNLRFSPMNIPPLDMHLPTHHINTNQHILDRINLKQRFSYLDNDKVASQFISATFNLIGQHSFPQTKQHSLPRTDLIPILKKRFPNIPLGEIGDIIDTSGGDSGGTTSTPKQNKALNLELEKVSCLEDTDEWGADEIALGGVAVNDNKETQKINEFEVDDDFHTNRTKSFNPPKLVVQFPLDNDYSEKITDTLTGKVFTAFISLAEKDSGGFADFINKLYEAIKVSLPPILSAIGAVLGAKLGAEIGGTLGTTLAGPIGTLIGVVAGLILGAVIGYIIGLLQDDVFEPRMISVVLPNSEATFNGNLVSPTTTLNYQDHGGNYNAYLRWRLER